jgi:hypothetical protein
MSAADAPPPANAHPRKPPPDRGGREKERLAEALRRNLRRRKAQAELRRDKGEPE